MRPARRVGQYHVLDRVASGGMAEVYRAKVIDADGAERLVALKRVLDMYSDDPSFIRMLIAEYQLSSLLVHPNIAQIHELLRTSEGYFIAMEYVDGKDLRSTLARTQEQGRALDVADAVYLMARALDGLDHAHVATTPDGRPLHLVHRDFSPSNILVGYDGSVKIIDFGIAKASVPRDRTAIGIIKGKVRYMSPEQANGDDKLTGQSDVFSAGSVMYELLSGQPAFSAPNEVELIYTVRRAKPVALREAAPHVPDGLVAIVERAMARLRRDRYPHGAAFRDALVTFLRAWAPGYRRTRLAKFMKQVWAREIEHELATLLEYAITDAPGATGENLLASASLDESIIAATNDLRISELATTPDPESASLSGPQAGLAAEPPDEPGARPDADAAAYFDDLPTSAQVGLAEVATVPDNGRRSGPR